ncbi:hypothetical protein [Iamia sp.]|uniref:hypothetical protein n=1 Tax=Iamia sp. TaxID=2722710 RepID=UPI002C5AF952|nr:hypothetical protein [Iamia sp.]HXH58991.1 hypothetical protein [Iamia sp.]
MPLDDRQELMKNWSGGLTCVTEGAASGAEAAASDYMRPPLKSQVQRRKPYCCEVPDPRKDERPPLRFRVGEPKLGELIVGRGSWSAWAIGSLDVRVRLEFTDPWIQITGVAVFSLQPDLWNRCPVSVSDLREVPLVALDALVNDPTRRLQVLEAMRRSRVDLSPTSEQSPGKVRQSTAPPPSADLELPAADGRRRPPGFYSAVAHAWSAALASGRSDPAAAIGEANGVEPGVVHGWVREARRKGLMAPSRRAKGTP